MLPKILCLIKIEQIKFSGDLAMQSLHSERILNKHEQNKYFQVYLHSDLEAKSSGPKVDGKTQRAQNMMISMTLHRKNEGN